MDPQPTTLAELIADLEAEHDDLDRILVLLDEAGWGRPTPASGWAVRDQVSHLAYFDDAAVLAMSDPTAFAALVAAALEGGDPMEEHLRRGRSLPGADLLGWWRASRTAMATATISLPEGARVPWFGPPMGALSFVSARLMETWAHGQDVADALDIVRRPSARLRHVAHLGVRTRPFSYVVRGLEPPPTPVAVSLVGPDGQAWTWDEAAGSRVQGSALDFCLVVTQRRNLADTDLVVEGPEAIQWMSIAQAFAGPPGPGRPVTVGH